MKHRYCILHGIGSQKSPIKHWNAGFANWHKSTLAERDAVLIWIALSHVLRAPP